MKHIVIISGKGGTGKTTIAASFCVLAKKPVIIDCDVDASNMHLLLSPQMLQTQDFYGGQYAVIDTDKCRGCKKCLENCRFGAITEDLKINKFDCEGCGLCARLCPQKAISMEKRFCGQWFISQTPYGPFVHARLDAGEENSGKLVSRIKQEALKIAKESNAAFVIADGPPGIGCPVTASLASADLAVIVCEPTLSAIYDMKRAFETALLLGAPCAVIINKWDINKENTFLIEDFCLKEKIPCLGRVSFSNDVNKAVANAVPLVNYGNEKLKTEIENIWQKTLSYLEGKTSV